MDNQPLVPHAVLRMFHIRAGHVEKPLTENRCEQAIEYVTKHGTDLVRIMIICATVGRSLAFVDIYNATKRLQSVYLRQIIQDAPAFKQVATFRCFGSNGQGSIIRDLTARELFDFLRASGDDALFYGHPQLFTADGLQRMAIEVGLVDIHSALNLNSDQRSELSFLVRTRNSNARVVSMDYANRLQDGDNDSDDGDWSSSDEEEEEGEEAQQPSAKRRKQNETADASDEDEEEEEEGDDDDDDDEEVTMQKIDHDADVSDDTNYLPLWSPSTHPNLNAATIDYMWKHREDRPPWAEQLDFECTDFPVSEDQINTLVGEVGLLMPVFVAKEVLRKLMAWNGYRNTITRDCLDFFHRFLELITYDFFCRF
jgi:hypothetical protein